MSCFSFYTKVCGILDSFAQESRDKKCMDAFIFRTRNLVCYELENLQIYCIHACIVLNSPLVYINYNIINIA